MAWTPIQELVANRAQMLLQPQLVFGAVAAKNPIGPVRGAASVKIPIVGSVSAVTYTPGSDMTIANLASTVVDLPLDTLTAFGFSVDDAASSETPDAAVANIVDGGIQRGMYAVADAIEDEIVDLILASNATITMDAVSSIDKDDVLDFVGKVRTELRKAGALMPGSWLVVPDILEPALVNGLVKLPQNADLALRTGYIGTIFGLDIYVSTKLTVGATPVSTAVAGCPDALAYVGSIETIESYRVEKQFATGYKGLYKFGTALSNVGGLLKVVVSV